MPESPEVQEAARFLDERSAGRTIVSIDVVLPKALKTAPESVAGLVGAQIARVGRIAKMLDVELTSPGNGIRHVVIHFGHDGWVLWHDSAPADLKRSGPATLMARVRLDDGSGFDLTDAGQWKALTIHVVDDPRDVPAVAKLGPDPAAPEFTQAQFARILGGRRKQLKALLQDQTALAGIGNAYSDEILHAARLSPVVHAALLTDDEVARLYGHTRAVLAEATTARRGIPLAELRAAKRAALRIHRRPGERCPVCGDVIAEFTYSGAAAQYCPTCQTGGASLA